MIFHENCLLADNSHEISYLIFFRKLGKKSQNLWSAAVVIGALRVNKDFKDAWYIQVLFKPVRTLKGAYLSRNKYYQIYLTIFCTDRLNHSILYLDKPAPDQGLQCLPFQHS